MNNIECPNDWVLQEDLENIALSDLPFKEFQNKTILITGATGLIGSQIIKAITCCNRIKFTNIKVIALVRNIEKARVVFKDIFNKINFVVGDITDKIVVNDEIDYIIHAASITTSKLFVTTPIETIDTMILGTRNILDLARSKNAKGVLYLSSMEVYGITDPELESISESELGYIDILSVRSCYSEGKRMAECICAAYGKQYGIDIKIARLAQTFGAGIDYSENRVFAQFAKSVINKTDIILHTDGKSVGNYCYTRDAVKALILILIRGESCQAYNVVNEDSNVTIRDMAYMVANSISNGNSKVIFDIPDSDIKYGYAPEVKMKLSAKKLMSLGWKPEIGLEESYKRMIKSMVQRNKQEFN